jgi:assimilatory nitrate reductase catalytic subunit
VQWPAPVPSPSADGEEPPAQERRLFEDGRYFTADGRARFVVDTPRPPEEPTSSRYPLVLLTGRGTSAQWHTGTRTSKSAILRSLAPQQLYVQIAPDDAEARGIGPDDEVLLTSRRGEVRARAQVTANVGAGQVFLPMHHPETNRLTASSFDPQSRQPSYKWSAVEVRKLAAEDGRRSG